MEPRGARVWFEASHNSQTLQYSFDFDCNFTLIQYDNIYQSFCYPRPMPPKDHYRIDNKTKDNSNHLSERPIKNQQKGEIGSYWKSKKNIILMTMGHEEGDKKIGGLWPVIL